MEYDVLRVLKPLVPSTPKPEFIGSRVLESRQDQAARAAPHLPTYIVAVSKRTTEEIEASSWKEKVLQDGIGSQIRALHAFFLSGARSLSKFGFESRLSMHRMGGWKASGSCFHPRTASVELAVRMHACSQS